MKRIIHYAVLASLLVCGAAACGEPGTGPATEPETITLMDAGYGPMTGESEAVVVAGVRVHGTGGVPVQGAAVQWTVAAGGGSVVEGETRTDTQGRSWVMWTLGPQVGEQALHATVAGAPPLRLAAQVTARRAVRLPDTVRISGRGHVVSVQPVLWNAPGTPADDTVSWTTQQGRVQRAADGPYTFYALSAGADRLIAHYHGDADTAVVVVATDDLVLDVSATALREGLLSGESGALGIGVSGASGGTVSGLPVHTGSVWTSSAPGVATVSATGVVTGHAAGEALIRMEWRGLVDTATVRVHPRVSLAAPATLWRSDVPVPPTGPMHFDGGGTLYYTRVGQTGPGGTTPTLTAVSPAGTAWRVKMAGDFDALPGGGVVITDFDQVRSLRADGSERWRLTACTGECSLFLEAGPDGTVYLAGDGRLRAVREDGSLAWSVAVPGAARAAVSGTGVVYVMGADSVTGVSTAGARLWATAVGSGAVSTLIDAAGTLYLSSLAGRNGTQQGQLAAVEPDGTLRWRLPGVWGVLSAGPAGTVLATDHLGVSARGARDGALRWRTPVPTDTWQPIAAQTGPDGRVYVPTCYLHVLDGASGASLGRTEHAACPANAMLRGDRLMLLSSAGVGSYTLPGGAAQNRARR